MAMLKHSTQLLLVSYLLVICLYTFHKKLKHKNNRCKKYYFQANFLTPFNQLPLVDRWMSRLKCKNCRNVFDYEYKPLASLVHLGPYKRIQCPACGKSSFFNVYSSVKDPVTWPPEAKQQAAQPQSTEEELEKKRIEESKYEKSLNKLFS
jgi:RNase P subunit RPR2